MNIHESNNFLNKIFRIKTLKEIQKQQDTFWYIRSLTEASFLFKKTKHLKCKQGEFSVL